MRRDRAAELLLVSATIAERSAVTPDEILTDLAREISGAQKESGKRHDPQPRTRPFRLTVDLPPSVHAQLSRWVLDREEQTGRNVDKRALIVALLELLANETAVTEAVAHTGLVPINGPRLRPALRLHCHRCGAGGPTRPTCPGWRSAIETACPVINVGVSRPRPTG